MNKFLDAIGLALSSIWANKLRSFMMVLGNVVRPPRGDTSKKKGPTPAAPAELPAGQTRKESEGVFVMRDKYAEFVPVRTGIAGERYFEVLGGTKVGDKVITGPFNSVRDLQDGDEVRLGESDGAKKKS